MKNNKKGKKIAKIFTLVFIGVLFTLMVTLADLFSSLITVGGFSFASNDISIPAYSVFAVSTSSHQTKALAEEQASIVKQQGGAGYIYMNELSYNVIVSAYETKADAEKVKSNLINSRPNTKILEITIDQIQFDSTLSNQEKNTLSNALNLNKTIYKKLYDLSVSLDTNVTTEVSARLTINQIHSLISETISNFETLFSEKLTTSLLSIKLRIDNVLEIIENLSNETTAFPYTSAIKNAYMQIIFEYKFLAESI